MQGSAVRMGDCGRHRVMEWTEGFRDKPNNQLVLCQVHSFYRSELENRKGAQRQLIDQLTIALDDQGGLAPSFPVGVERSLLTRARQKGKLVEILCSMEGVVRACLKFYRGNLAAEFRLKHLASVARGIR